MSSHRFLRPISIPDPPQFPDPHLVWMCQVVRPNENSKVDAGILGIPFDGGTVSFRRGARLGPTKIREAMYESTAYSLEYDADLSTLRIADYGDVDIDVMNYEESHNRVEEVVAHLLKMCRILLIMGGDHSVTYPCIKSLAASLGTSKKLGIIHFDAHNDCRTGWVHNSGLWVRQIQEMKQNAVNGENIAQIGIRGFWYSKFYEDFIRKTGTKFFSPIDVERDGIDSVLASSIEAAADGTDAIYVSVDIDSLDPVFAPGTDGPTPGGLSVLSVFRAIYELGQHPLVRALDVMEVSPPLDIDNRTSKVAAELFMRFLCGHLKCPSVK